MTITLNPKANTTNSTSTGKLNTLGAVVDSNGGLTALGMGDRQFGVKKKFRQVLSRSLTGRCKSIPLTDSLFTPWAPTANTAGLSLYNRIALADKAEAIRILIPNMHTSAITGVKVGLGLSNILGTWSSAPPTGAGSAAQTTTTPTRTEAITSASGNLMTATFASATSGTLAPAFDSANLVASYTATDWMPLVTVDRVDATTTPFHLLDVVIEYPAASIATLAFDGSAYSRPSSYGNESLYGGRVWRAWAQDVLAVTTPTAFTNRDISGYYIPIIVQYRAKSTGAVCELVIGDSIWDGTGATLPLNSFIFRATLAASSVSNPIEYCNQSIPGASSAMLAERAQYLMPLIKPGIFAFEWGTVNNISGATMSARQTQHALGALGVMLALSDLNDSVVLTGSFLPVSAAAKALGATDSIRVSLNTGVYARALENSSTINYIDFGPTIDDPTAVNGQVVPKSEYMSPDGIHPKDPGHAALSVSCLPVLTRALKQT